MSQRNLQFLQSEVASLEALLVQLPEARVIERIGFQSRLDQARNQLAAALVEPQANALPITFRGAPVDGSRSIDATFASQALHAFVKATDTVAASLIREDLKGRGLLPGSSARSLRIVDTAIGSFGFELELPPLPCEDQLGQPVLPGFPEPSDPYVEAIEATFTLIEQAASLDESAVSDLIADIHPRASAKVRAFAKILADHKALFAAEFKGRQLRLDRDEQVQHIVDCLDEANINESTETLFATIQGILPNSRKFEARLENRKVINGKIDRSLPDVLGFRSAVENKPHQLRFRVVNVRANRRYVLLGLADADPPQPL